MGTKASKFVVKVVEFVSFACWYPAGLMILKFLMGESVAEINLHGCVLLAGFGIMLQFLIWLHLQKKQTRKDIKDGVKYKIIGVPNGFF